MTRHPAATHRTDCRLCGACDLERVLHLAATPVGDAYVSAERRGEPQPTSPLDLFLCRGCGHAQLLEVIDPELLYGNFIYRTAISLGLVEHFQRYADDVLGRVSLPAGALAVDIGSNDGTLLRCFKARGLRVLGIDPAHEIAREATAAGIETLETLFTTALARRIREERGPAAIVTANNTFANVDDLDDLTEGIRDLLTPEGIFVCETGYLLDLVQQGLVDNIYHEHLGYFSVKPLEAFLRRHELELIDVERIPTKGGSLRATAQRRGGPRQVSPSVENLIALEARLGLDRAEPFTALAERVERVGAELGDLLRALKGQGKTVAGYGASVGVTTLLYTFRLGGLLSFLIDENPAKHHRFSPGQHLPVLPPGALEERQPDAVVILAWRYAQPIISKHAGYLDQGGQFIIPLPEVRIERTIPAGRAVWPTQVPVGGGTP